MLIVEVQSGGCWKLQGSLGSVVRPLKNAKQTKQNKTKLPVDDWHRVFYFSIRIVNSIESDDHLHAGCACVLLDAIIKHPEV